MQQFNYHEMWEMEKPSKMPHRQRAEELGIKVTDIPVSPVLTRLKESLRRIEEMYNVAELKEEGIYVEELLNQFTEIQLIEYIEEQGFEHAIALAEIEALLFSQEWSGIVDIPFIKRDFFLLRQFEESANGGLIDVSAYNTWDFIRGNEDWEFDKYKYFTDKVAEKVEDLAILHSAVSDLKDKESIRNRFISVVNSKYRNYALRLVSMLELTKDKEKKAELREKIDERNKQIRRLRAIWKKYAYWE